MTPPRALPHRAGADSHLLKGFHMAERITITIHTGNAAFEDGPATEIAACLRRLADRFERDGTPERVMDSNGNAVGAVHYSSAPARPRYVRGGIIRR